MGSPGVPATGAGRRPCGTRAVARLGRGGDRPGPGCSGAAFADKCRNTMVGTQETGKTVIGAASRVICQCLSATGDHSEPLRRGGMASERFSGADYRNGILIE